MSATEGKYQVDDKALAVMQRISGLLLPHINQTTELATRSPQRQAKDGTVNYGYIPTKNVGRGDKVTLTRQVIFCDNPLSIVGEDSLQQGKVLLVSGQLPPQKPAKTQAAPAGVNRLNSTKRDPFWSDQVRV